MRMAPSMAGRGSLSGQRSQAKSTDDSTAPRPFTAVRYTCGELKAIDSRLSVVLVAALVVAVASIRLPHHASDSSYYIGLAEGRIEETPQPFASRILEPAISRSLAQTADLSLETSFILLTLLSFGVFAAVVTAIGVRGAWLPAVLLLPWMVIAVEASYLPDIFAAALLAACLLALHRNKRMLAALLLFCAGSITARVGLDIGCCGCWVRGTATRVDVGVRCSWRCSDRRFGRRVRHPECGIERAWNARACLSLPQTASESTDKSAGHTVLDQ